MINYKKQQCVLKQNPYHHKKREIKQIVKCLDKKRSMEIFLQRSEGTLIQSELKNEMQKLQNEERKQKRSSTIKFNPTPNKQLSLLRRIKSQPPKTLKKISEQLHSQQQVINPYFPLQLNFIQQQNQIIVFQQNQAQDEKPQIVKRLENSLKQTKTKGLRPELEELNNYFNQTNQYVLYRRTKIIDMLVLCLMRRLHKKLYQALGIAIQLSSYFQENDHQIMLKTICIQLIGKIFKQISAADKKHKALINKRSHKSTKRIIKKRHSCFMINTLASQRIFLNRFAYKYNKSKLVKQTNFLYQQKLQQPKINNEIIQYNNSTVKMVNNKQNSVHLNDKSHLGAKFRSDVKQASNDDKQFAGENPSINDQVKWSTQLKLSSAQVYLKLSGSTAVRLPPPQILFASCGEFQNYSITIHQRSPQSSNKLFPYQYPLSLKDKISKKEYIYLLSKVNSVLYPQTQSYTMTGIYRKVATGVIIVMILVMLMSMLLIYLFNVQSLTHWIIMLVFLFLIVITSYYIVGQYQTSTQPTERYNKIQIQLDNWNIAYKNQNIIFKTTQCCLAIIICILKNELTQQESNLTDSINQSSQAQSQLYNIQTQKLDFIIPFSQQELPSQKVILVQQPCSSPHKKCQFKFQQDEQIQHRSDFSYIDSNYSYQPKGNQLGIDEVKVKSSRIVDHFRRINIQDVNFSSQSEDQVVG